ncbi:hypothetical protein MTO96_023324 [Rhipicephalus appendiculatus]
MALAIKKVLISDAVDASCVKILENHGVQVTLKTDHTKPELLEAIKGYDGLIVRSATKVTSDVIKAGQSLKVIGRAGTAELTCAMIITLSREIPAATMSLKGGKWDRKDIYG